MMLFMADGKFGYERSDRIENGVQRVAVAGEYHPRRERACTFLAKGIETLVDNDSGVSLTCTGALHSLGDTLGNRIGDRLCKLALKAGSRSKMVKEIGVRPAYFGRYGLQSHGLRAALEQQLSRRREGCGPAFFWAKAGSSY